MCFPARDFGPRKKIRAVAGHAEHRHGSIDIVAMRETTTPQAVGLNTLFHGILLAGFLISVVVRLVRAVDRNAEVVGLFLRQFREFDPQLVEV